MAVIERSILIILLVSVLLCWYMTRYNLPTFFSTGTKRAHKPTIDERIEKVEQQLAVFKKILGVTGEAPVGTKKKVEPEKNTTMMQGMAPPGMPPGMPAI